MKKIIVAIDGFSACGKSSTAKILAAMLNYVYIDTGAMYRAVTLYFMEHFVKLTDPKDVAHALNQINLEFRLHGKNNEIYLNGLNVEKKIRTMEISKKVSDVSAIKAVREELVAQQRKLGKQKGVVMDGRDIGTTVFPEAALKLFMIADIDIRSARRQEELLQKGKMVSFDEVKENLIERDRIDSSRKESPLRKADDALVIDTTHLTFDEQIEIILDLIDTRVINEMRQELASAK